MTDYKHENNEEIGLYGETLIISFCKKINHL